MGKPKTPVEGRFWQRVQRGDGCWAWLGTKNNKGYGTLGVDGRKKGLAHRVAYQIANGAIPAGKWVLHTCDNPGCVNPEHLYLGTHVENMRDMSLRGRGGHSLLTPVDAITIRERSKAGERRKTLAAEYGVSPITIKNINIGRTWVALFNGVNHGR